VVAIASTPQANTACPAAKMFFAALLATKRLQKIADARGLTVQELLFVALDREEHICEPKSD